MKIIFFAGSLRAGSFNKMLANISMVYASQKGFDCEFLDLKDYEAPLYDGDNESVSGVPSTIISLHEKLKTSDAWVVSCPEYNGSISGVLKNYIDWLSRVKDHCFTGKHVKLIASSAGALSGVRGLWHSRVPFEALGCHVFPTMTGIGSNFAAFDESGKLKDPKNQEMLEKNLGLFLNHLKQFNNSTQQ